jgi:hypothetical protein
LFVIFISIPFYYTLIVVKIKIMFFHEAINSILQIATAIVFMYTFLKNYE